MSHLRAALAKGHLRPTQGAGPLSTLRTGDLQRQGRIEEGGTKKMQEKQGAEPYKHWIHDVTPARDNDARTKAETEDKAASGAGGEPMDGPGSAPGSIHRLSPCAWSLRAFPRRGRREGRCEAALEDGAGRGGPQPLTCPIGSLTPMSKAADIGTRERPSPAKGRRARARADFHGEGRSRRRQPPAPT